MTGENITIRSMRADDKLIVSGMIKALYQALNAPDDYVTDKKIAATFEQLLLTPDHLKLEVFEVNNDVIGYALLFKFWYNEFGGMVLNIDELFVKPEFQDQGIASYYLSALSKKKNDYVAMSLEVLPENKRAYSLYKRSGFEEKETVTLYKLLE